MAQTRATEEILAAPLPDLIRDLGLAVAAADTALRDNDHGGSLTIPEAEIEVAVSISVSKSTDTSIGGGLSLYAFQVNAAYKNTFGYSEQASSRIKFKLVAVPFASADEGDGQGDHT
jgi:hypothetical protein